VRVTNNATIR